MCALDDCVVSGWWCQSVRQGREEEKEYILRLGGYHICFAGKKTKSHSVECIVCESTDLVCLLYYRFSSATEQIISKNA